MTQQYAFVILAVAIIAVFFVLLFVKFKKKGETIFSNKACLTLSDKFMNFYSVLKSFGLNESEVAKSLLLQGERISFLRDLEVQTQNLEYVPKVAVIGCFSAGKSSFINSIVEHKICPIDSRPTTASITRFTYGKKLKITEVTQELEKELSLEEYQDICRHPRDRQRIGEQRSEFLCEVPYKKLFGIEIYDSPGYDNPMDDGRDRQIASNIAKNSDIIIVVIDINGGTATDSLLQEIKKIKEANPNLICFVVVNRADQKPPSAIEKVKKAVLELGLAKDIFAYASLDDKSLEPDMVKLKNKSKKAIFNAIYGVKEQIYFHRKVGIFKKIDDILADFLLSLNQTKKAIEELFEDDEKFWLSDKGWSNLSTVIDNAMGQISLNLLYRENKNNAKNNDRGFWDTITFSYYYDYYFFIDPDTAKDEMLNLKSHILKNINGNTKNTRGLDEHITKVLEEFSERISCISLNPYLGIHEDEYDVCFTEAEYEAYLEIVGYKDALRSTIEKALDECGEELRRHSINRTYEKHIEDIKDFCSYISKTKEQVDNKAQKFKQKGQKIQNMNLKEKV